MKRIWQSLLMFNSFILAPASLVFFIYSVGAMVLLGQWQLFFLALGGFVLALIFQAALGIVSE